ncbi:MAG: hypothetical protein V1728_04115 [Candidatus Micrarchaeota archaeon]
MVQSFQSVSTGNSTDSRSLAMAKRAPLTDKAVLLMLHDAFLKFIKLDPFPSFPQSMKAAKTLLLQVPYNSAQLGAFSQELLDYSGTPGFTERASIFFGVAANESSEAEFYLSLHSYGIFNLLPSPSPEKSIFLE